MIKNWLKRKLKNFINENFEPTFIWDYRGIKRLRISNTVSFNTREGVVFEGKAYVGHYTHLDGTARLTIGEGVQMGECVCIFTHSSHATIRMYGSKHEDATKEGTDKMGLFFKVPCKIGAYTWIGSQVMILPGTRSIGRGCIIHPGAIIKRHIPDFSEVNSAGEIIGDTREGDKRYLNRDPAYQAMYDAWIEQRPIGYEKTLEY